MIVPEHSNEASRKARDVSYLGAGVESVHLNNQTPAAAGN